MKTASGATVTLLAIMNPFGAGGLGVDHSIQTPEELIEWAGKTCYKSHNKISPYSAGKFVQSVIDRGHLSVIEHSQATFRIEGISRACSHQLVRHRLMAISQESQRYVDEKGMFEKGYYVIPKAIDDLRNVKVGILMDLRSRPDRTVLELYEKCIQDIDEMYQFFQTILKEAKKKGLTKAKVNEDARFLLPNACCTEIVISANFREFRHIFEMRCDRHAQWEIRAIACAMLRILYEKAPHVFKDLYYSIVSLKDGTEALSDGKKES